MIVPLSHVLLVSFVLFAIGLIGVFTRRDVVTVFLSVEILLNAANVALVGFSRAWGDEFGQIATFMVIAVAAAEAAIGLMIVIRLNDRHKDLTLSEISELKG